MNKMSGADFSTLFSKLFILKTVTYFFEVLISAPKC
ncbi:hypothetical protein BGS_0846 [Beggiatoa sp. SS]|nr:hypothetical protein BGS_0846 [Beggiatoa sp. SS]